VEEQREFWPLSVRQIHYRLLGENASLISCLETGFALSERPRQLPRRGGCCGPGSHPEDGVQGEVPEAEQDPYQNEWNELIAAIRDDKPYNEVKRGAEASLVASMGRFAAHTGQLVTFDQMMNHDHEFAPEVDKVTLNAPSPLASSS
jgi:hypothetical protein